MFKKMLSAVVISVSLALTPGCAALNHMVNDPIAQVDTAETVARQALKDAQIAWLFVVPLLPADKAVDMTTKYYDACQKASDALATLDALKAQPMPNEIDVNTALKLESLAITGVVAVIHEAQVLTNKPKLVRGQAQLVVPGLDDADSESQQLQVMAK